MSFILISLVLGVVVGIVSSLFGIGGGVFIVPLLPDLMGFSAHQAIATSLASVFLVTLVNTVGFAREHLVQWRVGLTLGVPSGIMAFVSGPWMAQADAFVLRVVFLIVMCVLLIVTWLRRNSHLPVENDFIISLSKKAFAGFFALIAGFISAFTGIGAGVILSPIMFNLRMVRARELVPTTNLSTMLTTFSGTLSYAIIDFREGTSLIHFPMAISLFVVATVTSFWIRPYQARLAQTTKVMVLCGILFFIIIKQSLTLYRLHF